MVILTMSQIKKIVLRAPNWLGDAVMALQSIISIRKAYKDARIVVLCKAPLSQIFLNSAFIDEVYDLDLSQRYFVKFSKKGSVLQWLKKEQFCLGILYTNSFSSALLFKRAGIKRVVGYKRFLSSVLLTDCIKGEKKGSIHMSEHYLRLSDLVNGKRYPETTFIKVLVSEEEQFDSCFKISHKPIVICPTSAFGPAKCWPQEQFLLLIKKLVQAGHTVVIAAEKPVDFNYSHPRLINLAGKTNLRQFLVLLSKALVVVANDSGPLHVASHMQKNLVCLFGSSPVEQASPFKGSSIHYKNAACSPCFKKVCPIDFHCMKQITVSEVFDSVLYQLGRKKKVAVAILAGGKGQRLGSKTPKATLQLQGTTLLKHHLMQVPKECSVFILTSIFTHEPIENYLKSHNNFNRDITLYSKKALPCTNLDGSKSKELAPEGNGAFYDCIVESGFFQMHQEIEVVNCIAIDNPLAKPFCHDLVHACLELKNEAAFSCVKRKEGDSLGLLIQGEKGLSVVEYMDPRVESFSEKGCDLGFVNLFCLRKEFILRASKKQLPWHRVERSNKFHFERWIFDTFDLIKRYKIFKRDKQNYFYPLKTKDDLAPVGSIMYNSEKELR